MMHSYKQSNGRYSSSDTDPSIIESKPREKHASFLPVIGRQCDAIHEKAKVISTKELTSILDKIFKEVDKLRSEKQQVINLKDVITVLIHVRQPVLESVIPHRLFTLLQIPLNYSLRQWNQNAQLGREDEIVFRNLTKLLSQLFLGIKDIQQYPSWLTDPTVLNTIAVCLLNLSKSDTYFQKKNLLTAKVFVHLFDIYGKYQELLSENTLFDQEKLGQLVDPVVQCLASDLYLNSFERIEKGGTFRSKQEKFFLIRCPKFLTSYKGSRLGPTMANLFSRMLPRYTQILHRSISSINQWQHPMMRAVSYLLQIVNHGSINPHLISTHLSFIDHILTIIDAPVLNSNLQNKLSHPETNLINTAIDLLVNYIREPAVLTHIKQKQVTASLLRLTSASYEPLVYNIYTLLASTTSEEDIKSMASPGFLLSTVVNGLRYEIGKTSINQDRVVQLIGILKGLTQHDQLKEEILKQDVHSFLIQSASKLPPSALTPLLETFWSLSFFSGAATALRHYPELLEKVQEISHDTKDEALKKAADGLTWKLIQEPVLLDKRAKAAEEETIETKEVIIGEDGKEQVITTKKPAAGAQTERVFQYDIMISYCHADKELIKKIHQFLLSQGFKVWIDLDNMFGPAMNAMAEAVENSEFVLLSMSDSYKQSTYCQAEAEYAFGCKRRLVPLIVRPKYRADGWLGFMIGSRIYVDFGSTDFDTACGRLATEIARQRQRPLPAKTEKVKAAPPPEPVEEKVVLFSQKLPDPYVKREIKFEFDIKSVDLWLESDVLDFLYNHHLNELMPICEKMDGPALIQLYSMCSAENNRTYLILNEQLRAMYKAILPIGTYARFLSIMGKITRPPTPYALPPPPPLIELLPPPPIPKLPYDILVTSNMPIPQMLKMIDHARSSWRVKNYA